jgi:hypothetical protein
VQNSYLQMMQDTQRLIERANDISANAERVTLAALRGMVSEESAADDRPSLANAVYRAVCRLPGLAAGHKLAARVADAVLPAVAGG